MKLISIYSAINSFYQKLQSGGTYFGHQQARIAGYAEYSIYLFSKNEDSFGKSYPIRKQKDIYIQSLRQLVEDEVKMDVELKGSEKVSRSRELNKIVDGLDSLITDKYDLYAAQEFQYTHYQYQ
jgi:hypothetical protein